MHPFAVILMSPWFWLVMLAAWTAWWYHSRKWPDILRKDQAKLAKPGDLVRGGSSATSKTEKRVLASLAAAGYSTLPSELCLIVPLVDVHGNARKFTPDILVAKPKVVVEVDPYHWHGEAGMHKVYEDVERNVGYSACGWAIVRVRVGWPKDHPWRRIGKFDVVVEADDFYPAEHAAAVAKAVSAARPVRKDTWMRQLRALKPYNDAFKSAESA